MLFHTQASCVAKQSSRRSELCPLRVARSNLPRSRAAAVRVANTRWQLATVKVLRGTHGLLYRVVPEALGRRAARNVLCMESSHNRRKTPFIFPFTVSSSPVFFTCDENCSTQIYYKTQEGMIHRHNTNIIRTEHKQIMLWSTPTLKKALLNISNASLKWHMATWPCST